MAKKRNSKTYKPLPTASYPAGAQNLDEIGVAGFKRVESFLTPEELRSRYLFGVNLQDPYTNQPMSDDTMKAIISQMYAQAELDLNIDVFPVVRVKRIEYDRNKSIEGYGFGQLNLGAKNVSRILELSIKTTNSLAYNNGIPNFNPDPNSDDTLEGQTLFEFPLTWIDMSYARKGLIHLAPLRTFPSAIIPGALAGGGAPLIQIFDRLKWCPGFWYVRFQTGFENNGIPAPINNYVGLLAKREILNLVYQAIKSASTSISHDGTSQSYANPNMQIIPGMIQMLDQQLGEMKSKLKKIFSNTVYMTNW